MWRVLNSQDAVSGLYSLCEWRPRGVPGLLSDPEECNGLEAQADEDLGHHGEQQRP